MADNTQLDSGSGGDLLATKEVTHGGDTAKIAVSSLVGVSGSEGAYTFADINGDATNGLDVDVTRVIPGTGATHLGKAEDAAHSSGDTGVMALAVRQDTQSDFGADGDYVPLSINADGQLRVTAEDDAAVLGSTTYSEASTTASAVAAVRNDDLAALAGTDNELAPLQVSENGALFVCLSANDDYKYAAIAASTSGDNTLVAAAGSGIKIRVLAYVLVAAGDVTARFEDGASGTALSGQMDLTTNSGVSAPYNPAGYFETTANTLLNLELDAAVSVAGHITYIHVQ
jgi:hypothetical protein